MTNEMQTNNNVDGGSDFNTCSTASLRVLGDNQWRTVHIWKQLYGGSLRSKFNNAGAICDSRMPSVIIQKFYIDSKYNNDVASNNGAILL
jgi:hypothetical protein